jgi:hypothetical protein
MTIQEYSKKAVVLRGDTRNYRETLTNMHGRYVPYLKDGAGWIFSKKRANDLYAFIETIEDIKTRVDAKKVENTVPESMDIDEKSSRKRKVEKYNDNDLLAAYERNLRQKITNELRSTLIKELTPQIEKRIRDERDVFHTIVPRSRSEERRTRRVFNTDNTKKRPIRVSHVQVEEIYTEEHDDDDTEEFVSDNESIDEEIVKSTGCGLKFLSTMFLVMITMITGIYFGVLSPITFDNLKNTLPYDRFLTWGSTFKFPNMYLPNMYLPNMYLPNMYLPNMYLPSMSLPSMSLPNMSLPNMSLPSMSLPGMSLPSIDYTKIWSDISSMIPVSK